MLPKQINYITKQLREELTEVSDITGVDISNLTWMLTEYDIVRFDNDEFKTMKDIIPKIISDNNVNQSFSIIDIGAIIRQYKLWKKHLPNVSVFYAVKCNSDPVILRTLASLGVGFDVASTGEINMALETDTLKDKIIYANPCKRPEHISYARSQNINMMTFDNETELLKIANFHPCAELILRILVDDITNSKMKFGCKFGSSMEDVSRLLTFAKFHNLNIVGVSFHVGSSCNDSQSYYNSIERAKKVFDIAKEMGYTLSLLDIGGGFSGNNEDNLFVEMAEKINEALGIFFNDVENLKVIAEPGRFFATKSLTHIVRISGKKNIINKEDNNKKIFHYYIDSSVYGMFNNLIFDKGIVKFELLNNYKNEETFVSVIFGETCDSMDKIIEGAELPELACGDYLYVENHGAYTLASSSSFNGFHVGKPLYVFTY
jgi:ornithine decarboxylase